MKLTARMGEIEQILRFVEDATSWSPVPSGSALRVHSYSYSNWGILLTPKNSEWLYNKSKSAWIVEWQETDSSLNALVQKASQAAGLSDINTLMNQKIGEIALPVVQKAISEKGGFSAVDIGAGTGATTHSVISNMVQHRVLPVLRSLFLLVEPSASRLAEAKASINKLLEEAGYGRLIEIRTARGTEINALKTAEADSFDFALANAALHHNSFNRHLREINRVLKEDSPFLIGDWHVSMWEKPDRVYWLLLLLGNLESQKLQNEVFNFAINGKNPPAVAKAERQEVSEFRKYFTGDNLQPIFSAFEGLSMEERRANVGIMKFWLEVGRKFREENVKSPIYFLESHERLGMRVNNLTNAGFTFDAECAHKYHTLLKSRGYGDLSVVMNATKAKRLSL